MSELQMVLKFRVDLQDPLVTNVLTTVLQQGDANANIMEIVVKSKGADVNVEQDTVSGYLMRSDGERVTLNGETAGNVVRVTLDPACYQIPGAVAAFVRLTDKAGVKRTILRIAANAEPEGSGPVIDPGNRIPSIEDVIMQLEKMEKATEAAEKAAEDAQKATKPPYIGENDNWYVWDTETNEFIDTGTKARGPEGPEGPEGKPPKIGENGNWFEWDAEANTFIDTGIKAQGPQGLQGEQGQVGKPFRILGTYESLDALNAAVPSPEQGDIYNVGAEEPYSMYMWDNTGGSGHWLYLGELGSGGSGTVQSVDGVLPDEEGNVAVYAVRYDAYYELTPAQKATALANIGAIAETAVDNKIDAVRAASAQVVIPADGWQGESPLVYDTTENAIAYHNCIFVNPIPSQIQEYANCGIYLSTHTGAALRFVANKKPSGTMYIDVVGLHA